MKKRTFLRWMILVPVALSFLFGCSGKGKDVKKIEGDPEVLYKQGLTRFNKRDYPEALKKFEELKSSFPDSPPYTLLAELKVGDCHFLQKEYVEAIAAYEEFKKTHPSHEEIPYVQFQIGMSYFSQMLTLDRDQTPTKKALSSFEYLIANYPPSLFTEKAKEKTGVCKKRLADHEFYIGNFYYKQGRFQAAALRFEELLEKFPKDPDEDKTLYFLGKSYLEFEQWDKAEAAFTKIVTEYPKSLHYEEAKSILDKGLTERKVSSRKAKAKESEKKIEAAERELDRVALVKFEEEGKRPVPLKEEKKAELKKEEEGVTPSPVASEPVKGIHPKEEAKEPSPPVAIEPVQEDRSQAIVLSKEDEKKAELRKEGEGLTSSPVTSDPDKGIPSKEEAKEPVPPVAIEPVQEDRSQAIPLSMETKKGDPIPAPFSPSSNTTPKAEGKPVGEKRIAAFPGSAAPSEEKESVKKGIPPETKEAKLVDKSQPIDITSDKVEAYWKENLIIFKGNVVARQKDMVIYADSIEAVTIEDGKGIERVTAGGNVKIQQGLRVANCEKAIFYNLDQKVVLTGDPKVSEGESVVSGDEIVVDIDKNRVEVRGGSSGRGKAKIRPGEIEKLK
ncbi:MAG: lipopolysaccharide transport periplasmic protein LptA [Thermodesulfobacteriota bacterium]|jgi:outer membrane protein assembly factor BamD